jgi:hypothetical protein
LLQRPPILPSIRPPVLQPPSAPGASGTETFRDTNKWIYTQKFKRSKFLQCQS